MRQQLGKSLKIAAAAGAIRAVTVYCSSSRQVAACYHDAARSLGRALVVRGWTLVYGGNNVGTMGTLADAVREAGGRVVGITPRLLVEKGIADHAAHELIVLEDMRQRKAMLEARGDAFVALPGGLGTFEELFEILVGRYLRYHAKPIVILNVSGYYTPLLEMMREGVQTGFIRPEAQSLYYAAENVEDAVAYLAARAASPGDVGAAPEAKEQAEA